MNREFEDILDECIDRITLRGEGIEQCLASYPAYSARLEPLLQAALSATKATSAEPRPEFKAAAKYRLLSALRAGQEKRRGLSFTGRRWRWATLGVALLLLLLAGAGTVAASTNSLPDEPLYRVKLAAERVQMFFTASDTAKAKLHLKFAERRVKEIVVMAEKDKPEKVEDVTRRLSYHLEKVRPVARALGEKEGRGKDIAELRALLQRKAAKHRAILQNTLERAPVRTRPSLNRALELSGQGYDKALQYILGDDRSRSWEIRPRLESKGLNDPQPPKIQRLTPLISPITPSPPPSPASPVPQSSAGISGPGDRSGHEHNLP